MTVWDKLFSFKGRLGRRDWFVWCAVVCGVQMLLASIAAIASEVLPLPPWTILLPFAVSLPCLWPYAALSAKRMQDAGRSAAPLFWYLAGTLAFIVTIVVGMVMGHFPPFIEFLPVVLFPLAAYCVIVIVFIRGSAGGNRFGPTPDQTGESLSSSAPVA